MKYPKEIYAKIKPVMTMEQALAKAEKAKPQYDWSQRKIRHGSLDTLIADAEALRKKVDGKARIIVHPYPAGVYVEIKTEVPKIEVARRLIAKDKRRVESSRREVEYKYRRDYFAKQAVDTQSKCPCKCCCCK